MRCLTVHSNLRDFGSTRLPGVRLDHAPLSGGGGLTAALRDFRAARRADVLVVNTDVPRLMRLCALSYVLPRRFRLVSLDIVLGAPRTAKQRLVVALKKWLLRQVDLFIVFQHDLGGYARYYGVSPDRSRIIPFKANVWERLAQYPLPVADDGQLLFVGRTYRDVPTFLEAVRRAGVPCAMARHSAALAAAHGTGGVDAGERPANLHEVVDDGDHEAWMARIAGSRGIVLAIQPGTICCAGVSTLYDAMALGKPVIMTECPATAGWVTGDDLALVAPGDADALARALRQVSEDAGYRAHLAERGRAVAARVQGQDRLYRDVLSILASVETAPPANRDRQ